MCQWKVKEREQVMKGAIFTPSFYPVCNISRCLWSVEHLTRAEKLSHLSFDVTLYVRHFCFFLSFFFYRISVKHFILVSVIVGYTWLYLQSNWESIQAQRKKHNFTLWQVYCGEDEEGKKKKETSESVKRVLGYFNEWNNFLSLTSHTVFHQVAVSLIVSPHGMQFMSPLGVQQLIASEIAKKKKTAQEQSKSSCWMQVTVRRKWKTVEWKTEKKKKKREHVVERKRWDDFFMGEII